jgi:hypothetical protein
VSLEETGSARMGRLYEMAQRHAWNVSRDVPWTLQKRDVSPWHTHGNPLTGFAPYQSLDEQQRLRLAWRLHALELSDILHGEHAALLIASQLVTCMPTQQARLFASSQVADEARHVEFFTRYLNEVAGEILPAGAHLTELIRSVSEEPRWDIKLLIFHILIETLAMWRFRQLIDRTSIPLLRHALNFIVRDEARHVGFGVEALRKHYANLSDEERGYRSDLVITQMCRLAPAQDYALRVAQDSGWDRAAMRLHLRRQRFSGVIGYQALVRNLGNALGAAGLLNEQTKKKLTGMAFGRSLKTQDSPPYSVS